MRVIVCFRIDFLGVYSCVVMQYLLLLIVAALHYSLQMIVGAFSSCAYHFVEPSLWAYVALAYGVFMRVIVCLRIHDLECNHVICRS